MFELKSHKKLEKDIVDLDTGYKSKLQVLFLELKNNPVPADKFDTTKISGTYSMYRIRIGKFRIIYEIDWKAKIIEVLKIARRDEHTYG